LSLAIFLPSVVAGMIRYVTATPFFGVPIWVGIFWRRANRYGAWVSALGSALIYYGCSAFGWRFTICSLVSLLFGVASIVVVSLLTPPESEESLDKIFLDLHSPVAQEAQDKACA
jgi:Na+/proline symporter